MLDMPIRFPSVTLTRNAPAGETMTTKAEAPTPKTDVIDLPKPPTSEQAERLLLELLKDGEVASEELLKQSSALGISERTLKIAKQNQGVVSVRRGDRWYARLPDAGQ